MLRLNRGGLGLRWVGFGPRRRRTSVITTAVIAVLAAPAGAQAGIFTPVDPAAGIVDPVAGMEMLDRNCTGPQLDVNTASSTELEQLLKISKPASSRVLEARPFLRAVDLISVPGIGPIKLALLERDACAEPIELPEPAPLACKTGSNAVDLQSAAPEEIVERTGLGPAPVARLVAARPLPQDLQQVRAPRVPGLSGPAASELVAAGKVCVTPAPFSFAGKGWRWASEAGGAVISAPRDNSYQLFVPPGVAAGPSGAWGTVLPLPEIDPGRPRADFHLYGDWHGQVGVRLPDARLAATDAPMVKHIRNDGMETFTWGEAAAVGGGTVTVAMDSLSNSESSSIVCGSSSTRMLALYDCSDAPTDEPLYAIGVRATYRTELLMKPTFTAGPCDDSARVHSSGELPLGLWCTNTKAGPSTVTWSLTNTTGAAHLDGYWKPMGAVFSIRPSRMPQNYTLGFSSTGNGLGPAFAKYLAEGGLLLSDTTTSITKTQGSGKTDVFVGGANAIDGGSTWVVANLVSVLDDAATIAGFTAHPVARAAVECLAEIVKGGFTRSQVIGCVELGGEGLIGLLEHQYARLAINSVEAKRLKDLLRRAGSLISRVTLIGDAVASTMEQISTWTSGSGSISLWYDLPPVPPNPGGGYGSTNPAGALDGTIISDRSVASQPIMVKLQSRPEQGLVVLDGALAQEVRTVASYRCFAHWTVLRDQLPSSQILDYWTSESDEGAECDSSTVGRQYYLSGAETNVILRQFADGSEVAPAWFVDSESRLHPIPTGDVYRCLAQRYYVLDGRFDGEMDRFDGKEAGAASCPS